jgi:hypothetical protein
LGSYSRDTTIQDIRGMHNVSLDIIEVVYIEKTTRFAWEPHKMACFTQNDGLVMFVYLGLTAALPEIAPPTYYMLVILIERCSKLKSLKHLWVTVFGVVYRLL